VKRSSDLAAVQFARRHVRLQPQPPRSPRWPELARKVYRSPDELAMVGVGVFLVGVVVWGAITWDDPAWAYVALGAVIVVFGLACILAPAVFAYRVSRAIRDGLVVAATTIRAAPEDGYLEGRLLVPHPGRPPFTAEFSEDLEVAGGIEAGSSVDVLVDPRRPRLLFVIGTTPVGKAAADDVTA
jgi:uncharacterized protein YjeT (DUF2065 family)